MHACRKLTPLHKRSYHHATIQKQDPRDTRNCGPITLLNTDYKLLAKVLAERLKRMIDKFASPQQTGFVPGRRITDNARLCQVLQACQAEKNQKDLMVFLVLEKALIEYLTHISRMHLQQQAWAKTCDYGCASYTTRKIPCEEEWR